MAFEMSEQPQMVTVYHFSPETRELLDTEEASIPPHTGLPANSTESPPGVPASGKIPVYDILTDSWSFFEDHRGETVYSTLSGEPRVILELGGLPGNVTNKAPSESYQKWDGQEWINDLDAKKQADISSAVEILKELMKKANEKIAPLNDAIELGIQTEDEVTQLIEWKKYRIALSRIDINSAPEIAWPEIPA
ncbi:tail fiber assembly protein [Klebsiella sp. RHBSTW-00215]|uniref:tail fiber assembly protein n=1 Tax=Klebsiella sp. RHBSTW-00215 TaxID=2742640 RepID=UPI0015F59686|nr:tail fiber assembly protein [Klebsiella sp. RHBSTW-00215]MBA7934017.1 tail fiber assembly protein [Klebsiella sp. RHBSTW-00215]